MLTLVQCADKRQRQLHRVDHALASTASACRRVVASLSSEIDKELLASILHNHVGLLVTQLQDEEREWIPELFHAEAPMLEVPARALSRLRELVESEMLAQLGCANEWAKVVTQCAGVLSWMETTPTPRQRNEDGKGDPSWISASSRSTTALSLGIKNKNKTEGKHHQSQNDRHDDAGDVSQSATPKFDRPRSSLSASLGIAAKLREGLAACEASLRQLLLFDHKAASYLAPMLARLSATVHHDALLAAAAAVHTVPRASTLALQRNCVFNRRFQWTERAGPPSDPLLPSHASTPPHASISMPLRFLL